MDALVENRHPSGPDAERYAPIFQRLPAEREHPINHGKLGVARSVHAMTTSLRAFAVASVHVGLVAVVDGERDEHAIAASHDPVISGS